MKLSPSQLGEVFGILVEVLLHKHLDHAAKPYISPEVTRPQKPASASGMKQGIRDIYSMCGPIGYNERAQIDQKLKNLGLPHLYALETIWTKQHVKIIKRKTIRNDEEFDIVKGLLDYQLSDITDEESRILEELMAEYLRKKQSSQR